MSAHNLETDAVSEKEIEPTDTASEIGMYWSGVVGEITDFSKFSPAQRVAFLDRVHTRVTLEHTRLVPTIVRRPR